MMNLLTIMTEPLHRQSLAAGFPSRLLTYGALSPGGSGGFLRLPPGGLQGGVPAIGWQKPPQNLDFVMTPVQQHALKYKSTITPCVVARVPTERSLNFAALLIAVWDRYRDRKHKDVYVFD